MKRVTSRDNRIYKLCSRLGTKKYRDREDLYIAEGPNLVKELLGSGRLRYRNPSSGGVASTICRISTTLM